MDSAWKSRTGIKTKRAIKTIFDQFRNKHAREKRRSTRARGCVGCIGFEVRTRRAFEKDGFIVKVAEDKYGNKSERITVFGTAWYQLHHSTIRTDVR